MLSCIKVVWLGHQQFPSAFLQKDNYAVRMLVNKHQIEQIITLLCVITEVITVYITGAYVRVYSPDHPSARILLLARE